MATGMHSLIREGDCLTQPGYEAAFCDLIDFDGGFRPVCNVKVVRKYWLGFGQRPAPAATRAF